MLYSRLFGKTVKDAPKDATLRSHQLLYKAGFIRESVAGRYFFLPLGMKVQDKIIKVIEEEMDNAGAQKMLSPVLHPLELWEETNRTETTGFELMVIADRRGSKFALGGTAEEMFVDVIRKFEVSYKDLPCNIYQFSTKFRDEMRARGGLLRVREFIMKDAYSFHVDEEDFKKEYEKMAQVYFNIFEKLGLKARMVLADNGYIGGEYCHEFIVESPVGESRFFVTEDDSYVAHEDVAVFKKEVMNADEQIADLKEVEAIRGNTMEDGEKLHKMPMWRQIKDVMYVDEKGRYILAVIRGDLEVNEVKLKHLSKAAELRAATEEEIRDILHSEPGFISPVGIKDNLSQGVELLIVGDDSLRGVINAYGGANKKHVDMFNVNTDRDYKLDLEGDIAMAQAGLCDINSGKPLIEKKGVEVGNIFQLGYHYSHLMKDATFMDKDGVEKPYYMGCYGIGLGRSLATIVEILSDDRGIVWPELIAPYQIHLVGLDLHEVEVKDKAVGIYNRLVESGVEVLFDDREETRAGEKFADADLIGIPYRVVVSKRTTDQLEVKQRSQKDAQMMDLDQLVALIKSK